MLRHRHFLQRHVLRSQKSVQKVDLHEVYPCPVCRHRSTIQGITLTDAFGCDRCQQIYVICEDGFGIEQLSGAHPYRRVWRWTGKQWKQYSKLPASGWLVLLAIAAIVFSILGLWLLLPVPFKILALMTASLTAWAILTSRR